MHCLNINAHFWANVNILLVLFRDILCMWLTYYGKNHKNSRAVFTSLVQSTNSGVAPNQDRGLEQLCLTQYVFPGVLVVCFHVGGWGVSKMAGSPSATWRRGVAGKITADFKCFTQAETVLHVQKTWLTMSKPNPAACREPARKGDGCHGSAKACIPNPSAGHHFITLVGKQTERATCNTFFNKVS